MALSKAVSNTALGLCMSLALTAMFSMSKTSHALAADDKTPSTAQADTTEDDADDEKVVKAVNEKILPLIVDAYNDLSRGDAAKAIKTLNKALKIDPDSITARRYLAFALVQNTSYVMGLNQMQKLSKITPMNAFDWYVFGEAYSGANSLDHALRCYQQALTFAPAYHAARGGAVKTLVKQKQFVQAMDQVDKGNKLAENNVVKKYYATLRQGVLDAELYQKESNRLGTTQGVTQELMDEQASKPVLINPSMSEGDN